MHRWFRWRRVLSVGLGVFLLGMVGLGLAARSQSRKAPAWWAPPAAGEAAAGAAERTEQGLVNEAHRVRADEGEWTLELTEEDVNAWLALRLPAWLASQDPPVRLGPGVGAVQALFKPGLVVVAAETGDGQDRKVLSLGLTAGVDDAGRLVLSAKSASVGRLGLPVGWALRAAAEAGPGDRWAEEVRRGAMVLERPWLRLADARQVRIVGVEVVDGGLRVRCRTVGAVGR